MGPPRRRLNYKRLSMLLITITLVITLGVGSGLVFAWATEAPSFDPNELDVQTTSVLYDMNQEEFARLHAGENRTLVQLKDIPLVLRQAFLATEDSNFYEHHGVDFIALARAAVANVTGGFGAQGASTITQQLVKNAYLTPEKTLKRKVQEMVLSFQLERKFSKDEIFQMYLNRIFFGEGAYGAQAASQTFFGKNVGDLTLSEAALLAGLPNAPSRWSPYRNPDLAEQRRQLVLSRMVQRGYITPAEGEAAKKAPPRLLDRPKRTVAGNDLRYPYFVDAVIEECIDKYGISEDLLYKGGLKIYTTVDPRAQKAAEAALADKANYPPAKDNVPVQAAIAVIDNNTGEARAIVGGREYYARRGFNRATALKRQPGSVFKPIAVYGPALEMGKTPATVLDDVPVKYGSYEPGNYDGSYRGLITMREATQFSVNVYAVKMLNEIGVQKGFNFAKDLGINHLDEKNDMVLGLALGGMSQGTNPLDMAGAYSAFANQGVWNRPHLVTKIVDSKNTPVVDAKPNQKKVMKETTAYLMTNMLETVVKAGTGTKAQLDRPVAGKTGTTELSQDIPQFKGVTGNKDAWFAGYTPELTGVVWMGYDDTDRNHYLYKTYGGSYPAQIWRSVMSKALQGVPIKPFARPGGITEVAVDIKSGLLPSALTPPQFIRTELMAENTVPQETSNVWVAADLCADTKQPHTPGDGCSQVVSGVFLSRPTPYTGTQVPLDAELETPIPKTAAEAAPPPEEVTGTTNPATPTAPTLPATPSAPTFLPGSQESGQKNTDSKTTPQAPAPAAGKAPSTPSVPKTPSVTPTSPTATTPSPTVNR
ncbi:PBP1A family penicillin-binding protein [Heliophilum fasciatum]|uniref:Penicillin-binding protein 1A n=1 Tax=Heliophilum fasciatum TaxID=35700 RepID=A0A4V2SY75_9FIRM|nr:PBP1A family penicillin-binding protein [Heliophilum fasciatum]MCW2276773.1 penicillin-binding protein 1A [Heliophilum fasciatum]TCP68846.1 penicillin-binding protein 1A [Heliophilum fasciatum]